MSKKLRILLLEDDAADAELIARALKTAEVSSAIQRVHTEAAFRQALNEGSPDLILADYSLPDFNGSQALHLAREHSEDIPFIIVSGTVGEEGVVELMRQGVTDFVSKSHLEKLPPSIQRVMREVQQRNQKRLSEISLRDSEFRFRAIFESAGAGIAVEDLNGKIIESNRALQQMLGYPSEELQEITRADFTHSSDPQEDQRQHQKLLSGESDNFQVEKRFVRRDGRIICGRLTVSMVRDATGQPQFSLAMIEDITERQRAEEAHQQYAAIVEHSLDAIVSATIDGIIFSWNPAAERVYGYTASEANGRPLSLIIPQDKDGEPYEMLERIKRGEHTDNFETLCRRKDGSLIHVSITTSPIKDASGKVMGASAISRDITERKRAEAALRESEENYRKLVELSPDGILILSEGKYVYLNSAALEILGARTTGQILGKAILDLIHPDCHELVKANIKVLDSGRDVPLHELKIIRVDGRVLDVEISSIPFTYRGNPAYQVVVRNITERKRAEEALRRSEAGLARAQRIAHLGNWEWDRRADKLTWSDETYRIFGLERTECACSVDFFFRCVHPEDRDFVHRAMNKTLLEGKPYSVDHRIILPNGEIRTVNEQAEVVLDEKGEPIHLLGTVLDITRRKRAENLSDTFAKLGERLSSATTAAEAASIIADKADKLFGWDACSLLLCSADLQTFKTVFDMDLVDGERHHVPWSSQPNDPGSRIRCVLDYGAQLVLHDSPNAPSAEVRSSGDISRISASNMYVPVRNGPKVVGVFSIRKYSPDAYTQNDLDALQALGDHCGGALERIRAEAENQKLAAFPQFNPNPVLELAADGSINYFNEAAQQMAQSLGRRHPSEFLPPETAVAVKECLATGEAKLRIETMIENRAISWSFFPVQAIGVVHCYAVDITERQVLESQVRQSQKMESIGQLAGGVAHDFNNILTVIQGHTSLLSMSGNLSADAQDSAQQIGMAAERAANLTRQLLTFSRRQVMQPKNLDLNEVVNQMTKMLRRLLGEDITLQVSYTPALPLIHADPGMIEQILLNLAVNSRDAMPRGGSLFIDTSAVTIGEGHSEQAPEAVPGEYICVSVRDTGTGIPADVLPHIFEPFFTTKDVGKGTGLGLATVYGIVQQHRGWIKASSTMGKETVFQVFLPAIKGRLHSGADAATPEPSVRGGKETILLVEDEPPLRELVHSVLNRYGYRVIEAVSGFDALGIWEQHKDEVELLLTDMVMPQGVSGRELAEKLLAEKPELKVIYSSGYSLAVVGADMVLQEGLNFLQKPYHPRKLVQAVRDCLDG